MSDPLKTIPAPRAPFDSQFDKEESHVRERASARESVTDRTARIDRKLALANLLLAKMPPTNSRARLLTSAMLRRDEVLLDAVLAEMESDVAGLASTRRGPGSGW
jgi:hypothetical protein